jgi:hypothetical protein
MLRATQSPIACVRWMRHGIGRSGALGVLVRRLGCYGETAACMRTSRMLHFIYRCVLYKCTLYTRTLASVVCEFN